MYFNVQICNRLWNISFVVAQGENSHQKEIMEKLLDVGDSCMDNHCTYSLSYLKGNPRKDCTLREATGLNTSLLSCSSDYEVVLILLLFIFQDEFWIRLAGSKIWKASSLDFFPNVLQYSFGSFICERPLVDVECPLYLFKWICFRMSKLVWFPMMTIVLKWVHQFHLLLRIMKVLSTYFFVAHDSLTFMFLLWYDHIW